MTILNTERLLLRTWEPADLETAFRLWGDPEVMTFIDARGTLTKEQVRDKLTAEMECQIQHGVQYWPIFARESGDFVGCSGLKPWVHSPRGGHELGFHIIRDKWGHGYAHEAAQGVIQYAFQVKKLPYIMAGHHPENLNSRKILLRLGFQFVEDVFFKPTGLWHSSYQLPSVNLA